VNLKEAYDYSRLFLSGNKIDESDFKALCVVCSLADIKNNQFEMHSGDFVSNKKLADMLWKLKSGEPLQYVIGKWDFYESEFYVGSENIFRMPCPEE
jgi:methylase of polypeptide subunit release factors